jgi:vacuolar-type H+-ATPase subunit F/Vma7
MRSKMIVVTSPEMSVGFRLGGIEVVETDNIQQAEETVEKIILGSEYGLVAVNEDYLNDFSDRLTRLIGESEVSIIVAFPAREANVWKVEDRLDYVADLIRSAIGYHIKLTR